MVRVRNNPHLRGVNSSISSSEASFNGSSPLAWGQLPTDAVRPYDFRVIPTRVGSTPGVSSSITGASGHPHSRGVNLRIRCMYYLSDGSSPLAWGQLMHQYSPSRRPRVIPTRVGSTASEETRLRGFPGHPHSRGVNFSFSASRNNSTGSSPLAWGQLPSAPSPAPLPAGHPHSRGVN